MATVKNKGKKRSVLQKAQLSMQTFLDSNSYLQMEQAKEFLVVMVDKSMLLKAVNTRALKSPTSRVNKIDMPGPILWPGHEGVAVAEADKAMPTFADVDHAAKLFKGEVGASYEALEDNLEGEAFWNTIRGLTTKAVARDLEELGIKGDTSSTNRRFKQFNGLIKLATSHVADGLNTTISVDLLHDLLKTMPEEYRRDRSSLAYYTHSDLELDYRKHLSNRATPMGDLAIGASGDGRMNKVGYGNIPIETPPLWPADLGPSSNQTVVLLMDAKIAEYGIWRKIMIETDKDIRRGKLFMVISIRADIIYKHEPMVAKSVNVSFN